MNKRLLLTVSVRNLVTAVVTTMAVVRTADAQWTQTSLSYRGKIYSITSSGSNVYLGTGDYVYRSTDGGVSWAQSASGLRDNNVPSVVVSGSTILAGTMNGVHRSTDNGESWAWGSSEPTGLQDVALLISGSEVYCGTYYHGVWVSADNGDSWSPVGSGLTGIQVECLLSAGPGLVVGGIDNTGMSGGIYVSSSSAWTQSDSGLTNRIVSALALCDTKIFAGTSGGVFVSADGGTSWTPADTGLSGLQVSCFAVSGESVFAGFAGGGIYRTEDFGNHWAKIDSGGLSTSDVTSLAVVGGDLFASTWGAGLWRRPLSQITSSVGAAVGETPLTFALLQNYPNPFNPTTRIQFTIVNRGLTRVNVFDLLGREVARLVNEVKEPGRYTVEFNGSNLSSGVYFYRIQAGDFTQTKRLLLLK